MHNIVRGPVRPRNDEYDARAAADRYAVLRVLRADRRALRAASRAHRAEHSARLQRERAQVVVRA